jgi:hypothetical protein
MSCSRPPGCANFGPRYVAKLVRSTAATACTWLLAILRKLTATWHTWAFQQSPRRVAHFQAQRGRRMCCAALTSKRSTWPPPHLLAATLFRFLRLISRPWLQQPRENCAPSTVSCWHVLKFHRTRCSLSAYLIFSRAVFVDSSVSNARSCSMTEASLLPIGVR